MIIHGFLIPRRLPDQAPERDSTTALYSQTTWVDRAKRVHACQAVEAEGASSSPAGCSRTGQGKNNNNAHSPTLSV
jgi:hypothetical protein